MDTFAPEFSKFWLGDAAGTQADAAGDEDAKQQNALKELADLVSAARSIV
jgi:hypothetical protein